MTASAPPTCDVLGVSCVVGDIDSAGDVVIARALSGAGGYGVFCNVHVLMTIRRRPDLMKAVREAWAAFPDGAPVAWFQRRVGMRGAERIGGPDLMPVVFDRGRVHGLRHALIGSTPKVVDALAMRLQDSFPGVEIVTVHGPEWGHEEDVSVLLRLAAAKPHVIWCAFGAPKQELWMARRSAELEPALLLGVGAAFDFLAGKKARAPQWMRSLGLEWLHRFFAEPRRLGRRYLATNSRFVLLCAREYIRSITP